MSFFDFFKNTNTNTPADDSAGNEPVIIFVTPGNEVEIPASEAANNTLQELFTNYAEVLGIDADQIGRFTDQGRIVNGSTEPRPGRIYQGSADSFTKGSRQGSRQG